MRANSVDLYWIDDSPTKVRVTWDLGELWSVSREAPELAYQAQEIREFPNLERAPNLYLHKATLIGFKPEMVLRYQVHFEAHIHYGHFRSLPDRNSTVRLIAYADSETEPESTGKYAKWGTPDDKTRTYLVDQTTGYRENLRLIEHRTPDAVLIAGDLVEASGEQRDWDEFWRHNQKLAGSIPLLTAPGNHEYWAGPKHGKYSDTGAQWAINKYRTYFHPKGDLKARDYYSQQIGRITVISLNSADGSPHGSKFDSNHYLKAAGKFAPSFHPGSEQWNWLEHELKKAQAEDQFVVVMFHHCPYSSGVHGFEVGSGPGKDEQSGQALRILTPLLLRHGVDLLISGHDEMFERSEISGSEQTSSGQKRLHRMQVYDVGVGGDGLRGPKTTQPLWLLLGQRPLTRSVERWDFGKWRSPLWSP